jgi:translation initiation factor IF-3
VGVDGEQLGIVSLVDAIAKAEAAELDLVEIAPTAKPPVCRIMDYGKFKYREAKKQHEAKLKLKRSRSGSEVPAWNGRRRLQDQASNLTRFLSEGDKPCAALQSQNGALNSASAFSSGSAAIWNR